MKKTADEKLLARYQKGDVRAFTVLLERHQRGVFNFVCRFTGRPELAEDLVQEVFLRLVNATDRFERRSRFTTWLYTIARNLCIDQLRKQKHRDHISLDQPRNPGSDSEMTLMDKLRSSEPLPDQGAQNHMLGDLIQRAIGQLSEEQREVFLMREEAGMPFEQIARVVEAPVNTIKSRMRYALQSLRAYLEAQGVDH